jgi:hypothetical protein
MESSGYTKIFLFKLSFSRLPFTLSVCKQAYVSYWKLASLSRDTQYAAFLGAHLFAIYLLQKKRLKKSFREFFSKIVETSSLKYLEINSIINAFKILSAFFQVNIYIGFKIRLTVLLYNT